MAQVKLYNQVKSDRAEWEGLWFGMYLLVDRRLKQALANPGAHQRQPRDDRALPNKARGLARALSRSLAPFMSPSIAHLVWSRRSENRYRTIPLI